MALALSAASGVVSAAEMPANVNAQAHGGFCRDGGQLDDLRRHLFGAALQPLAQINTRQREAAGSRLVRRLRHEPARRTARRSYIDGVIYVSTAWSKVYAFDARTGKQLWQYDPKTPGEWIRNVCCGIVNRGIAAWNGKIYLGTLDGRLVAIDAKTGKEVWSTLTIDKSKHYSITSAPRVAKGKVLIGESGGEYGVRGYIGAYDAETGKLDWRFYTVPGDPARRLRERCDEEGRARPGAASGGSSAAAARCGTRSSTTRRPIWCTSAPATARRGIERYRDPRRRRQPVSRLDHRGEARHRRVRLALPGDAGATPGTTTR